MSIIEQLSSQIGDRTEKGNRLVAAKCLKNPALLTSIAAELKSAAAALVGDCAEVLTKVAEKKPHLIVPHLQGVVALLAAKTTRVRWEAAHTLALTAELAPQVISRILPQLEKMAVSDKSTIVRDYAVNAIGNYAGAGASAAQASLAPLRRILAAGKEKQAARVLQGLTRAVKADHALSKQAALLAEAWLDCSKSTVKKAAQALLKAIES